MIIRRIHNHGYTIVANQIANDPNLSFDAVGLMTYLLSRPDNWNVHVNQLKGRGKCGRDKVRAILGDCIEAGYIKREHVRSEDGRQIVGVAYLVYDQPTADAPDLRQGPEKPSLDHQGPENQGPENQGPEKPSTEEIRIYNKTSQEPVERDREREDERPEGLTKRAEALFFRSFVAWDRFAVSPKKPMLAAWARLTWLQMVLAADAVPRYLAAKSAEGMKHAPAISTYLDLEERLWEGFPPPAVVDKPAYAPAFGPVWGGMRMRDLVTGPKTDPSPLKGWEESAIRDGRLTRETLEKDNRMRTGWPMVNGLHQAAERGIGISAYGMAEEQLGKLCEFVPINSDVWKAWKVEHDLRGWPWLPDPGSMRGVYFPAGGPGGLEAFEQAVRGNHDAGGREAAE